MIKIDEKLPVRNVLITNRNTRNVNRKLNFFIYIIPLKFHGLKMTL
jgi:hypothetical protein